MLADHSAGFKMGLTNQWEDGTFGQCWPHLIRKYMKGEYVSKKHKNYDNIKMQLKALHMAYSPEIAKLLKREIGRLWDKTYHCKEVSDAGDKFRRLWNEYCQGPWFNWSIGQFDTMLCTPSQQCQESWHKLIFQNRIPGAYSDHGACVLNTCVLNTL